MFRVITYLIILFFLPINASSSSPSSIEDSLKQKRLWTVSSIGGGSYLAGISYLQYVWYRDHERVPFHFYNDSKGYLQMDKAGHAFSAYYQSLASYHAFRWAGVNKNKALLLGGLTGFLFQTPIEVFDGLYEGWGFSWSDIAANTAGSLLFVTQEALFDKQILRMKFSYSPSGYPKYHSILGENELESFILDYNGHSYWLSINLQKASGISSIPKWLNLALGYSANGMIKEFENPKFYQGKPFPHLDRYRQFLISMDLDLSKIKTKSPFFNSLLKTFNVLKIPFPAIEYNSMGKWKIHPLYY